MDTVPLKFVDSVVELFGKETLEQLAREVRHRHWKPAVNLHHCNRVYYEISFRLTEEGIQHLFKNVNNKRDLPFGKDRRFARIVCVKDVTSSFNLSYLDGVEPLGEAETGKLLNKISPLIDQVSGHFDSYLGSADCTRVLLTSFFKRVYLRRITLTYCGQITYDFLEDQINNSPFLTKVEMMGYDWPKTFLKLITNFCLKGRPGNHIQAVLSSRNGVLDSGYIQHLLDLWKTNGNLNFRFNCVGDRTSEDYRAVMKKYKVLAIRDYSWHTFFRHPTAKTIARVLNQELEVECFSCECDHSEKCPLKEKYPQYHNLWP
uniref:F-box domain-containing protein n=1 Tax=Steinernema glaseri TaxID=37863 RepID=A0A1I7ZSX6_9BILA